MPANRLALHINYETQLPLAEISKQIPCGIFRSIFLMAIRPMIELSDLFTNT